MPNTRKERMALFQNFYAKPQDKRNGTANTRLKKTYEQDISKQSVVEFTWENKRRRNKSVFTYWSKAYFLIFTSIVKTM